MIYEHQEKFDHLEDGDVCIKLFEKPFRTRRNGIDMYVALCTDSEFYFLCVWKITQKVDWYRYTLEKVRDYQIGVLSNICM